MSVSIDFTSFIYTVDGVNKYESVKYGVKIAWTIIILIESLHIHFSFFYVRGGDEIFIMKMRIFYEKLFEVEMHSSFDMKIRVEKMRL